MKNLEAATTRRTARMNAGLFDEMVIDNFAGIGGASMGIEAAIGRSVDVAINHSRRAIAGHQANHPHTRHLIEDVFDVDPIEVTAGRPVGLAWFSPDCTHHSRARGCKPVVKKIRGLAWIANKWAKLVRPRVILLENVREFQDWGPVIPLVKAGAVQCHADGTAKMVPDPARKGTTFRRFVAQLRNLGYAVEYRVLNAADYGAPTHRRRFFLIARCDGQPIQWPEPTHGPGRKPYRTAAECIDWSLPCPSIFLTREEAKAVGAKRPLAEKTMRRIAMGIKRYVLDNPKPFIVTCNHGGPEFRGQAVDEPLRTVTAARDATGVVMPFLSANYGEAPHQVMRGQSVDEPMRTVTPANNTGVLIAPALVEVQNASSETGCRAVDRPAHTITANPKGGGMAMAAAFLSKYHGQKANESCAKSPEDPLPTQDASNRFAVSAAFLAKHYGGVVGHGVERPLGTVTAVDHHSLVQAFLLKYYGTNVGQDSTEPLHTITGNDRFGVVMVSGQPHVIADIGLRMLTPRELLRAQFGKYAKDYILIGTKSQQVDGIGNSVCPQLAEALVRANYVTTAVAAVAG